MHPDRIHIVASIPRSFLNKMLRREVREQLHDGNQGSTPKVPVPTQRCAVEVLTPQTV